MNWTMFRHAVTLFALVAAPWFLMAAVVWWFWPMR